MHFCSSGSSARGEVVLGGVGGKLKISLKERSGSGVGGDRKSMRSSRAC